MAVQASLKRTIVRANTRLAAVRAAFGVLERFAPALGARWAGRIWCTLPTTAARLRDDRPCPGERSTIDLDDGRQVAVESWGFGPPVYLMHGWGGWRGQLGAFVTPLTQAGRRVVAVDAPSHGESGPGRLGPKRSMGTEFCDALAAAAGKHGKPTAVIAHSFGGTAAAVAVLDGLPVARLVMIAPSASLSASIKTAGRALGFGERIRARMLTRLGRVAGRPVSDFDITDLAQRTKLPPTLVVHDRLDKEVPYDEGAGLATTWPEAELATTEGLGHQRILHDPGVVELVVDYVTH